jgi:hypothetical protein
MRFAPRRAFTLFQLLVVLAILLLLLWLLLPALQMVRAKAAQTESASHLHNLGIAVFCYADANNNILPPGVDAKGFSAAAYLLPFMESRRDIDFKKSIDDPANAAARKSEIKLLLSPRDPLRSVNPEWGATNYLFNDQVFVPSPTKVKWPEDITDGMSVTVLAGETLKGDGAGKTLDVHRKYVRLQKEALKNTGPNTGVKYFKEGKNLAGDRCASWMDGHFLQGTFNGRLLPNDKRPDVSCGGVSGVSALRSYDTILNVLMLDGHIQAVNTALSHETWKAAMTPRSGD